MRTSYRYLSSIIFSALYLYTALIVLIVLPFAYLRIKSVVKAMVHFWAKSSFWIMGKKIKISGRENYSNKKRYIIISNHSSLFDILAIMSFSPNVTWFGHSRLMKVPLFSQILKMLHYIPLKEKSISNTKQMLDEMIQKSKKHTIAIFPEGTRTLDGSLKDFFRGFVHVLRATDAEILPVTLNGFYSLKPKHRTYINFNSKLSIVIHPSIKSDQLKSKSDQEILTNMKEIIESKYITYT